MKSKLTILTLLLAFAHQFAIAQESASKFTKIKELGGIEEYLYTPNGMQVLLVQDNAAPVVTVQIVYRVGSKHEVSGNTGSTHLLEHLMFKGTGKFNKRKGTSIDGKLTGIGAQMNATTWHDRTNYYETIPSDKIAIALEIEADRMRNSLLLKEDKEAEMTVVRNEFERGENDPGSVLNKEIWSTAYMAHTYHHSTIGWRSDIENMPIEVLRKFYNTYYWPDNATLTIIGDFQKDNLFKLVDKYFGSITRAPHEMPQPYTEEPRQYGPRRVVIKKPGQMAIINIAYKIPGRLHKDLPALTVLGQLLGSGASSVLDRAFVDTGLAFYAYSGPSNFQEVGLFTVGIGFAPTGDHHEINKQAIELLEKVKKEGVKQEDVDRIVSKLNAQTILYRDGSGSIAGILTESIAGGDWTDYVNGIERLSKVTAEDVKRVANKYLAEDQSTTGFFIPRMPGSNDPSPDNPSNFIDKDKGKYFYRDPAHDAGYNVSEIEKAQNQTNNSALKTIETSEKGGNFTRKTVAGIDVITAKTGAKDFITVTASFPIGGYSNSKGNKEIPSLTTDMLSKGTTKNDKFRFSQKLERLGVRIGVYAQVHYVTMNFKCLKKDVNTAIDLFAEQLRYPLFDEKEFDILKQQIAGSIEQGKSDPKMRGRIALSQAIYPKGHPNYLTDIERSLEGVKKATINKIKAFHKTYFGPAAMHLVAVGDIDTKALYSALKKSFDGWKGGSTAVARYSVPEKSAASTQVITIPEKPSAEMFIGQYTGIKRTDSDFMPFYIATSVLGGGFSARLMRTVRDEDGLTYSINALHSGHTNTGGYWYVNASFNPELFQKGLDATMVQIDKWVKKGITAEELAAKKSNLIGSYKVGMATTGGLASTILGFVERGLEPGYIDQYPKEIQAVTLDQANNAIKKFIDPDRLIIIKSGSLPQ